MKAQSELLIPKVSMPYIFSITSNGQPTTFFGQNDTPEKIVSPMSDKDFSYDTLMGQIKEGKTLAVGRIRIESQNLKKVIIGFKRNGVEHKFLAQFFLYSNQFISAAIEIGKENQPILPIDCETEVVIYAPEGDYVHIYFWDTKQDINEGLDAAFEKYVTDKNFYTDFVCIDNPTDKEQIVQLRFTDAGIINENTDVSIHSNGIGYAPGDKVYLRKGYSDEQKHAEIIISNGNGSKQLIPSYASYNQFLSNVFDLRAMFEIGDNQNAGLKIGIKPNTSYHIFLNKNIVPSENSLPIKVNMALKLDNISNYVFSSKEEAIEMLDQIDAERLKLVERIENWDLGSNESFDEEKEPENNPTTDKLYAITTPAPAIISIKNSTEERKEIYLFDKNIPEGITVSAFSDEHDNKIMDYDEIVNDKNEFNYTIGRIAIEGDMVQVNEVFLCLNKGENIEDIDPIDDEEFFSNKNARTIVPYSTPGQTNLNRVEVDCKINIGDGQRVHYVVHPKSELRIFFYVSEKIKK